MIIESRMPETSRALHSVGLDSLQYSVIQITHNSARAPFGNFLALALSAILFCSHSIAAENGETYFISLCENVFGPESYDVIEARHSRDVGEYLKMWGSGFMTLPNVLRLSLDERALFGSQLIKSDSPTDVDAAIQILSDAAKEGSMLAFESIGVYHLSTKSGNEALGFELLHCAAEKKGVMAATILGNYYGFVPGAEPEKAIPYLEMAVDGGSDLSKLQLAMWLFHGHHVERNVPRAAELFRQSAESGMLQAAFMYAYLLEVGYDKYPPNLEEAIVWYLRAAEGPWRKGPPEAARVMILQGKVDAARKILEEEVAMKATGSERAAELLNSLKTDQKKSPPKK